MTALYHAFIQRPLLVNLTAVFVVLTALLALGTVQYDTFPKIDLGLATVITARPGAGPEDMELSVTIPLEDEILEVDDLAKVTSNSMEGLSVITIRIDPDSDDPDKVLADLQKAVDRAAAKLPADLPEKPRLEEISSQSIAVLELHVSGLVPEAVLRRTADHLSDALREIAGIAGIDKIGYRDREVRILLAPERLHRLGISPDEIAQAVRRRNLRDAGGSISSFTAERKVVTVGQFDHPKQVEEVIIRAGRPGDVVRIRDVADVMLDYEDWQVKSRLDGTDGITLSVRKTGTADGLTTAAAVKRFVQEVRPTLPTGVRLTVVNDLSRFTYDMLDVLIGNAVVGFALALGVLIAFFPLRIAFWISVGLPVALAITVSLMPLAGLGINVMTLTAMILVLGMLVDDAIVTGESIARTQEQGDVTTRGAAAATAAVARPVITSTATTILAFAPAAFLGGLEGEVMWMMPVVVALMLGGSMIECQFMLPCHLAHGARVHRPKRWFTHVQRVYDRMILAVLRRRYAVIAAFVAAAVAIAVWSAEGLRFTLYPDVDIDTFFLKVELPEGSSFAYTADKTRELETLVREVVPPDDLLNIATTIGEHDTVLMTPTEGRSPAWARVAVYMRPQGERRTNSNDIMRGLRARVRALAGYKSIILTPLKDTPVAGKPVEVEVIASSEAQFEVARDLVEFLKAQPGVTEVWTSFKPGKDVVRLELDHLAMAARGLTVRDVIRTVRVAFDGEIIDSLRTIDEEIDYRLQYRPGDQGRIDTLRALTIINADGQPVPLRAVAEVQSRPGEASINHYLGDRTVTVFAEIDRGKISAAQANQALADHVRDTRLIQRFDDVRLWYGGELEQQQEAIGNVGIAFQVCLLAMFLLLIILFNSVTQPLLIMTVIPFGFVGVLLAFLVQGLEMSMMSLIGILGLAGVLVNDSVVMIDHVNRTTHAAVAAGRDRLEAVAEGAMSRLRPIVITSITTVAALAPAAYGLAGDNPYMTPMIMVILWGVLTGTLVSLVLLPCLYMVDEDLKERVRLVFRAQGRGG